MNALSKLIIEKHLVRKTKAQKAAFREALIWELQKLGIEAREEKCRNLPGSVNVIAGDAENAELIFGAHYDTPARMLVPNFITPRNPLVYIGYQLMIVLLFIAAALLVSLPMWWIEPDFMPLTFMVVYWVLLLFMMMGPANPNTYNDNTSGVVALIEMLEKMDEDTRKQCAFVFFDHEELGMMGSAAFAQMHKKAAKHTPMINLDCIGDGEHLLLTVKRAFRKDEKTDSALKAAFEGGGSVLNVNAASTVYPSDQSSFKKAVGVAALKKRKVIGYYMDRIHTAKDTVLEEKNLERVTVGMIAFAQEYLR